jgi:hypothetical protein
MEMNIHQIKTNRRQFLEAAAIIAGAALLPGCAHSSNGLYISEMEQMPEGNIRTPMVFLRKPLKRPRISHGCHKTIGFC